MTTTATDLIARSSSHDEIVHAPYTPELAAELATLADDSVDTGAEVEFWGTDWRVHLTRVEVVASDDSAEMHHLALIDAEMTAWAIGRGLDRHEAEDAALADHAESVAAYDAPRLATLDWVDISATEYERIREHGGIGWRD